MARNLRVRQFRREKVDKRLAKETPNASHHRSNRSPTTSIPIVPKRPFRYRSRMTAPSQPPRREYTSVQAISSGPEVSIQNAHVTQLVIDVPEVFFQSVPDNQCEAYMPNVEAVMLPPKAPRDIGALLGCIKRWGELDKGQLPWSGNMSDLRFRMGKDEVDHERARLVKSMEAAVSRLRDCKLVLLSCHLSRY